MAGVPSGGRRAGVLFDVDGTLVDTTYLHAVTWWEALRQGDHDVPMSRIHHAIGMGSDRILDALLGADRDRSADGRLTDAHAALYSTFWDRLRPLPGAADLLRACAAAGQRVVLASSASQRELVALRRALDTDEVIDVATSASDAEQSKPLRPKGEQARPHPLRLLQRGHSGPRANPGLHAAHSSRGSLRGGCG